MTSMPCLIMQYKPYIVELPPTKEAYNSYCSTSTPYMHSLNQQFINCGITLCSYIEHCKLVLSEFFQGVSAIACTLK